MRIEHWFYTLPLRLRSLFRRRKVEQELNEELSFHIERKTEEGIAQGLTPEEARYTALRAIEGLEQKKEECRDRRGFRLLEEFVQDMRYAVRLLRKGPVFSLTAILTLVIGIGANTTIFSLCNAILLRMLPVPNPQELFFAGIASPASSFGLFSYPDLEKMQEACQSKAELTGFTSTSTFHATASERIEAVKGQLVSSTFFRVLKVAPLMGRDFSKEDNKMGSAPVALISQDFWQRSFAGSPFVLGKTIYILKTPIQIVGVVPRDFSGVEPGVKPDLWMPLAIQHEIGYRNWGSFSDGSDWSKPWMPQDGASWLRIIARTPNDPDARQLHARLSELTARQVALQIPKAKDSRERETLRKTRLTLEPAGTGIPDLAEQFSQPLLVLMILVSILLLVGCSNLANLLLARAQARKQEIMMRLSLGASRSRIIRQLFTESLLIAMMGGLLSIPVAYAAGVAILRWISRDSDPVSLDLSPDWKVFAFTAGISLLTAILFGLIPAFRSTKTGLLGELGMRAQSASLRGPAKRSLLDQILLAGQLAFSIVSLVIAGLLVHTLANYARLPIGLDRNHVLSVSVDPTGAGYFNDQLLVLWHKMIDAINAVPGVQSSAVSTCGLLNGCIGTLGVEVPGETPRVQDNTAQQSSIGPAYFATVGIAILRGREFDHRDRKGSPAIAVVNESFEKRFFKAGIALGRYFKVKGEPFQIGGIVQDARVNDMHQAAIPMMYFSIAQYPGTNFSTIQVRAEGDPRAIANEVRLALQKVDRQLPVFDIVPLSKKADRNLFQELLAGRMAGIFSLLTLGLASLGLYGVLSYRIAGRTNEIGIRMALGAQRTDVVFMILREALPVLLIGSILGILAAGFASKLLSSLLYQTGTIEPSVYLFALLLLIAVCLVAAWLPAWRASRIDPMVALRHE